MGKSRLITGQSDLKAFCGHLSTAPRIAFDTEFVPEYTYTPQLCLVQVATDEELAVLDPLALDSLEPFWEQLVRPEVEVIAHAAKEEMRFCHAETGRLPERLFDVQLAAGFVGLGHPLSHDNLVQRTLGCRPQSGETRTDWRRRPLSDKQIDYALDDVRFLLDVRDLLAERMIQFDRWSWYAEESQRFLAQFQLTESTERWRRVSGAGGLSPKDMAVLRELFQWRDDRAKRLDKPPRWVLRDDLLIELAKRQPRSVAELAQSRGLGQVASATWAKEIVEAIDRGRNMEPGQCPERIQSRETPDEQMVLKILAAAMLDLANKHEIATGLIGSNDDLRDLMSWHLEGRTVDRAPKLAQGWRARVCGQPLADCLEGRTLIRIETLPGNMRLVFEPHRADSVQDIASDRKTDHAPGKNSCPEISPPADTELREMQKG